MSQVFRCFTEKKPGFDIEAKEVYSDLSKTLSIKGLDSVRLFCRYDCEGIDEERYALAKTTVFSEPMCDICCDEEMPPLPEPRRILAIEPLPGQYDQRSDSCAQCIQLLCGGDRPLVHAAKVYVFSGQLSGDDFERIKRHLINPVEACEASLQKPATLFKQYPLPESVETLAGFIGLSSDRLREVLDIYGLAMDFSDLLFLQSYFKEEEKRDPTITEVRMIDTYWSDHCRHTTFLTELKNADIRDKDVLGAYRSYLSVREELYGEAAKDRPVTLMDMATCAPKLLKKRGYLKNLDESDEINACSIRIRADRGGNKEDWLLMFKNETHNHPTEIEPFGGAATCLGGAIRDPLSGRVYVHQAMRVTGAGDPRVPENQTISGKLSQRKICQTASAGYSSYGNQIGLATGLVHEYYHPGYVAKRMEIGAVVGAAPAANVVRKCPEPGDVVILLGGRTGRDGCGGATGSSKSHTESSLSSCGSEVQKGNPPEERKIQRLFRNPEATRLIKRCNDFGAGGVSVAIGELADGLSIDLDRVPKKYEGLDGTELAISESQERMAVVVSEEDASRFIALAGAENLEATAVAVVTGEKRLKMTWNGRVIVDVSRSFLNSNGAKKQTDISVPPLPCASGEIVADGQNTAERTKRLLSQLNICLTRGLSERFDGSIGAGSILMPFGGKNQLTPAQVMAAKLPVLGGDTTTCSVMSFGFDPYLSEQNPFSGAQAAVVESVARLVAAGCDYREAYLTLQEYFERMKGDPARFGKPASALLGAFSAQVGLCVAAIGGKDSMSGSFEDLDVPPTLVSFAIAPNDAKNVLSPEFKQSGSYVYLFRAPRAANHAYDFEKMKAQLETLHAFTAEGKILSAWALSMGGVAEGIAKMAVGNDIGLVFSDGFDSRLLFSKDYGSILAESKEPLEGGILVGRTTENPELVFSDGVLSLSDVKAALSETLEPVYKTLAPAAGDAPRVSFGGRSAAKPLVKVPRPKAVIPVFPGTNCEYDTARAIERAGGDPSVVVIRNRTLSDLADSKDALYRAIRSCQMIVLPGGFSGGDEPDGSGKFIAAFFRNEAIKDAVNELINRRDGLILGICNGFQALIKLGLVPFGEIRELDGGCPTLTYNLVGRHQSKYVSTRVCSVKSPWLLKCGLDEVYSIPVSHGEGRFVASDEVLSGLIQNGQIAFQYVDPSGNPSMDIAFNPNGSVAAVEGITSPDGRVLGKMGHTERVGGFVAKNISGKKFEPLFEGGVEYFR